VKPKEGLEVLKVQLRSQLLNALSILEEIAYEAKHSAHSFQLAALYTRMLDACQQIRFQTTTLHADQLAKTLSDVRGRISELREMTGYRPTLRLVEGGAA